MMLLKAETEKKFILKLQTCYYCLNRNHYFFVAKFHFFTYKLCKIDLICILACSQTLYFLFKVR